MMGFQVTRIGNGHQYSTGTGHTVDLFLVNDGSVSPHDHAPHVGFGGI